MEISIATENVRERGSAEIVEAQAVWAQVNHRIPVLLAKNCHVRCEHFPIYC